MQGHDRQNINIISLEYLMTHIGGVITVIAEPVTNHKAAVLSSSEPA